MENIRRNLMKYIPPPSELSYACMAEDRLLFAVTFYSVFRTIFSQVCSQFLPRCHSIQAMGT
ncbi:hypothetical protein OsI_25616 [Oryza sativa Indica Group]|uniref:Uncharacterized protein n=1 Tax=Oryza sativa subsp. indica TaxID=39946 RepID=B8B508_ORYSI|nr:hypothetical protein OsI_25616 [Oryza sativa Indica Group]